MNLPPQLQNNKFRFILLKKNGKAPTGLTIGEDWKKKVYSWNSEEVTTHDGNIGIIGGEGLTLIDLDGFDRKEAEQIKTILGQTFTVETGSRKGFHLYYFCTTANEDIHISADPKKQIEIRANFRYVVCPGSTHESGNTYDIVHIDPITSVAPENLELVKKMYKLFTLDLKAYGLWKGNWKLYYPDKTRSEAEQGLCTIMFQNGMRPEEVNAIMDSCQIGKWQEKRSDAEQRYKELTLENSLKYAQEHPLEKQLINGKPKALKLSDLMATELPPIEYYIDPMIPKDSLILIGGRPGVSKSLLSLYLSLCMGSSKPAFGQFESKDKPRILYYDLENGERVQHLRVKYLKNGTDFTYDNIEFRFDFNKLNIETEFDFAKDYDVIMLDSYRRFLKGDENNSEITDIFYKIFLKPLRDIGKTVIIVHHFRKGRLEEMSDEDIQDLFRGSSDITGQVEIVYGIFKGPEREQNGCMTFDVGFAKAKNRLGLKLKDFMISVTKDDTNIKTDIVFKQFGFFDPNNVIMEFIYQLLQENPVGLKREVILKHVIGIYRTNSKTVDRMLIRLTDLGTITKVSTGFYKLSYLTDETEVDKNV